MKKFLVLLFVVFLVLPVNVSAKKPTETKAPISIRLEEEMEWMGFEGKMVTKLRFNKGFDFDQDNFEYAIVTTNFFFDVEEGPYAGMYKREDTFKYKVYGGDSMVLPANTMIGDYTFGEALYATQVHWSYAFYQYMKVEEDEMEWVYIEGSEVVSEAFVDYNPGLGNMK